MGATWCGSERTGRGWTRTGDALGASAKIAAAVEEEEEEEALA